MLKEDLFFPWHLSPVIQIIIEKVPFIYFSLENGGGGLSFILTTINKHIDITASMKKGAIPDARLYQK